MMMFMVFPDVGNLGVFQVITGSTGWCNEPCQWLYLGLNRATVLASRICLASGDYNSDIFWS